MSALQLLLLGAMAAWTPSLLVLAALLRQMPIEKSPRRNDRA